MEENIQIQVTNDKDVILNFIDEIVEGADSEKSALGFIPHTEYPKAAAKEKILVAYQGSVFLGFILFGGKHPVLKILQTFVAKEFRRTKVATHLVEHLRDYGNANRFSSIRARVAAELDANRFWRKMNFLLVGQDGESDKKRLINIYELTLEAPTLFPHESYSNEIESIQVEKRPIVAAPSYGIDVNILLDLLRERKNEDQVKSLFTYALASETRLFTTHEFKEELLRNKKKKEDYLLKLLETLPELPTKELSNELLQQLHHIVIPKNKGTTDQDISDLRHLGHCVVNGLTGFVTSEEMLLSAHHELKRHFGLEVVTPGELGVGEYLHQEHSLLDDHDEEFVVRPLKVEDRPELCTFLKHNHYSDDAVVTFTNEMSALAPSCSQLATRSGRIVGALMVKGTSGKTDRIVGSLCVQEESSIATSVANCLFGILLSALKEGLSIIELEVPPLADKIQQTAKQLGFFGINSKRRRLIKYNYNGVIDKSTWKEFAEDLRSEGLEISQRLPSNAEIENTGILLTIGSSRGVFSLFDLETILSPLIILTPGRSSFIVPIREKFAHLLNVEVQMPLLPEPQGVLRAERAYFASVQAVRKLHRGAIVIFYVSGSNKGRKEAVGICRVTACGVFPLEIALTKFKTQGVYRDEEIHAVGEQVGVFSFDRFTKFRNPIPYKQLVSMGCVGGANLVSTQRIDYEQLTAIIRKGAHE